MQKLEIKAYENTVGADPRVCPNSKGITLIALIITIIVMLILVGVTINVALNGGLFEKAREASKQTEIETDRESLLGSVVGAIDNNGQVDFGTLDNSLPSGWTGSQGEYTSPNGNVFTVDTDGTITYIGEGETPGGNDDDGDGEDITLPEGWTQTTKPKEWDRDNEHITAVTDGTNTIPLPEGYEISSVAEENTIEEGIVIKDSKGNEFVWIPVSTDFVNPYNFSSYYSEPTELEGIYGSSTLEPKPAYDSQEILTELYGTKSGTEESFYNYTTDFAYATHYDEMVESVNKYGGFFIGRYETTIDGSNQIGSVYDTPVLTADKSIPQTNNRQYRWYGLYYTQRNSNVVGNDSYIQTNMIWGQQWDAMIGYFESKSIDYSAWGTSTQGAVVNSGQSTNESGAKDEIYNIYDLRTNGGDWTAEAHSIDGRVLRGGDCFHSDSASSRVKAYPNAPNGVSFYSSRLTLYIK